MPAISKIRFTHVLYEGGNKRYNDETFWFDGHNGAILLENGGGKTVFIQTAIQAMLPHTDLAGRKLKDTLLLENGPAHVAVEWILNDKPRRRYAVTCVSLFQSGQGVDSYRYAYEYGERDEHGIDRLPFVRPLMDKTRPADKGEIHEYYASMAGRFPLNARLFSTIREYKAHLEEQYQIISSEWEAIVKINDSEGGIEKFFDDCKTTSQLLDRLLIPTVEQTMQSYEEGKFASMFETHQEGFRQYRDLKVQIGENRAMLREMDKLMQLFERLHEAEQSYDGKRREARAYWELAQQERAAQTGELERTQERLREWKEREELLDWRLRSLAIARQEREKEALAERERVERGVREQAEEQLKLAERRYYSLQFAEYREKRLASQGRIAALEQSLRRLEQSDEEQRLEEQWELNGGRLRSLFDRRERELRRLQEDCARELGQLEDQLRLSKAAEEELLAEQQEWQRTLHRKDAERQAKEQQRERIARGILANPLLEKVEAQMPLWAREQQQLEDSRVNWKQRVKRLQEEAELRAGRRREIESERVGAEQELAKLEERKARMEREQDALKRTLAGLRPVWERIGSVYERQASLEEQLAEGISLRRTQRQRLLDQERLAYRYVDDHGGQQVFFADAMAERIVRQWERQFPLLQLGTDFIASLGEDAAPVGRRGALWPVTIVTTTQEKAAVARRLQAAGREFAFPLRLLDVAEAAAAAKEENSGMTDFSRDATGATECWIVPEHWLDNESGEAFERWKAELRQQAEAVQADRESKERELALWEAGKNRLEAYFGEYSLTASQESERTLQRLRERLLALQEERKRAEAAGQEAEQEAAKLRASIEQAGEQIAQLGLWLRDAQQYMELGKELAVLERELVPVRNQLAAIEGRLRRMREQGKLLEQDREEARRAEQDHRFVLQLLQQDEAYIEVQSFAFVEPSADEASLRAERKELALARHKLGKERTGLEDDLRQEREKSSDLDAKLDTLKLEHPDLEADMPLPPAPDERRREWWGRIGRLREECAAATDRHSREERALSAAEVRLQTLRQQFRDRDSDREPATFESSLEEAARELEQAGERLGREREELRRRQEQIERQVRELDEVLQVWNKYALTFRLEDATLVAAVLSEEERGDFSYRRARSTETTVKGLSDSRERMERERGQVRLGKQRLKEFCLHQVQDVKLRQMFLQGIDAKERYDEMLEFQQAMETRIQHAIHIMEHMIQTHDQDLQQFIQHMHTHLKQLVQELRELPKKTRVRTEDGWREMYAFTIPEWDEQLGKERIRQHIEWILRRLDQDAPEVDVSDASAAQRQASRRRELEKWLDSRQLLQVVLQNETIGIACRKVSNDIQVTKASYSWEQSNRWSGGEKWSKNMTLFLGLLNYVAERKQYIQGTMKRHRTVILDNPFGKASSEHVLSPVFFIAEQLGFQIIALTAHAEGKFLQDYFPVVYSCRLRHAADTGKQIMEATQRIRHAYFRDHAPEALDRLGARGEQLELF